MTFSKVTFQNILLTYRTTIDCHVFKLCYREKVGTTGGKIEEVYRVCPHYY